MSKFLAIVAVTAFTTAGCFEFTRKSTMVPMTPSPTTAAMVAGGQWGSVQSFPGSGSLQESCTGFTWTVWQSTSTAASGSFAATCWANMAVAGSATATLSGNDAAWSATATATAPGGGPCAITLSGSAVLSSAQIELSYSGTTCLGAVSGKEILKKAS